MDKTKIDVTGEVKIDVKTNNLLFTLDIPKSVDKHGHRWVIEWQSVKVTNDGSGYYYTATYERYL